MAGNGIQSFLSEVRENDLARSHRFEVIMGTPQCMQGKGQPSHISLMCEEAIFPGLMMGSKPFKYNNRVENRATFLDYTGESATFTLLCDRNWKAKNFFDEWMRGIVTPSTRYVNYYSNYTTDITLHALDNKDQVTKTWIIKEAWPRSLAPISMAWSNTQFVRVPVTFTFKTWELQK